MTIEQRLDAIEQNLDIALGRLNAIHATVHTLVRTIGADPSAISSALNDAALRVEADVTASPLPEKMVAETVRVLAQISQAAAHAAKEYKDRSR